MLEGSFFLLSGQAVNETNTAAQKAEEAKQQEKAEAEIREQVVDVTGGKEVDPTKLSVPLIVVAPKMENDFHAILLKTVSKVLLRIK